MAPATAIPWFVAVMSSITAGASLSMLSLGWAMWKNQKQHDRALFGDDSVEEWDGLVKKVAENREALEERGDL